MISFLATCLDLWGLTRELAACKGNFERMQIEGTKRCRSLKIWFEGVKKDMMDCKVTKGIVL